MRTEKEIREELEGRRNAVENLKFLYQRTKNLQFKYQMFESRISVVVLEWVLGERELEEEITAISTDDL